MAKKRKNQPQTIVAFLLQGMPRIIADDDGDPHAFPSVPEAIDWVTEATNRNHLGLTAAETIVIYDLGTGETDTL